MTISIIFRDSTAIMLTGIDRYRVKDDIVMFEDERGAIINMTPMRSVKYITIEPKEVVK